MIPSTISGTVRLIERGAFGFPWATLVDANNAEIARVGRYSALNVFLGRGQRIELADGRKWRLKSRGWQRYVCPTLVDEDGLKLATSAPGVEDYAITCRDQAFTLIPAEKRPGRPRRWQLLSFNEPIAVIGRNPYVAEITEPVPLPAVLMSFCLATIGVMGEKELVQQMGWTGPVAH